MPRLKLHFDFGWHLLKGDAKGMRERMQAFRPHVCVIEETSLNSQSRAEVVRNLNYIIERARKGDQDARKVMVTIARGATARDQYMSGFGKEMYDALLTQYRCNMFTLETHGRYNELQSRVETGERKDHDAIQALLRMDVETALRLFKETCIDVIELYKMRDANIVENLLTLHQDLVDFFPRLSDAGEVRVFIRYGLVHTQLHDEAVRLGLDSTRHYIQEENSLENELIMAMMANHAISIDDGQALRAIIANTISSAIVTAMENAIMRGMQVLEEPSLGYTTKKAREYMSGKTNEDLLKLFEETRTLPFGYGLLHLASRESIKPLWLPH